MLKAAPDAARPRRGLLRLPWWRILRATWDECLDDQASFIASGVAFRVALAVFPGIALLVWVGSQLLGPEDARSLARSLGGFVPDAARSVIRSAVASSARHNEVDRTGAALLGGYAPVAGIAFAVWSTNSGMWALFDALNVIYDETERRSTLKLLGVTVLFTLGTMLLFAVVTGLLVLLPVLLPHAVPNGALRAAALAARWSIAGVCVAASLSLLFRYAPNRPRHEWPFVTVGSALGATLLVLSSAGYSWVTDSFADLDATYGSLSTVVSFLLWLWICFIIVLAAAELDSCIEVETRLYGDAPGGAKPRPAGAQGARADPRDGARVGPGIREGTIMSKHTVPADALVVVADGAKAILLRNTGTGHELSLKEEKRLTPKNLGEEGPSGSRPEDQTPSQTDEATFAKQLAHALYTMRHRGDYKELVLIADPQTLGQMRECLHKEVEASMAFTLSKDYTNHSVADIEKALG